MHEADPIPAAHPAADLFPLLDGAEMGALVESVRAHGLIEPVLLHGGLVLDGRNRLRACALAGVPPRFVEWTPAPGENPYEAVWARNADRRHLDAMRRALLRHAFDRASEAWQAGQAAMRAGADVKRAATAREGKAARKGGPLSRAKLPATEDTPAPPPSGGVHVTRRALATAAGVSERTAQDAITLHRAAPDIADRVASGAMRPAAGVRAARARARDDRERAAVEAAASGGEATAPVAPGQWRLVHADIATVAPGQLGIEPGSVDAIVTDPPYPGDQIEGACAALASLAAHALRPGGSLFAMVGQSYLPRVLDALLAHGLRWHWMLDYRTPGGQAVQLWDRRVNCGWKPVLWLVKGEYGGKWIGDVVTSAANDNDKRFHRWGQSESGMADLVRRASEPGDLVLDPFCGGGTTGAVALALGRRFVGIDRDAGKVAVTRARLAGSTP